MPMTICADFMQLTILGSLMVLLELFNGWFFLVTFRRCNEIQVINWQPVVELDEMVHLHSLFLCPH